MTRKIRSAVTESLVSAAKINSGRVHIIYRGGTRWAVKKEGSLVAKRVLNSKSEAITIGRNLVKENKASMLVIHEKNGMVSK